MRIYARAAVAVLAVTAAAVTAGCGGSGSGSPTSSGSAAASQSAPATSGTGSATSPATAPNAAGSQAPGAGRCHTSMLSAHVIMGNPGAGQRYAALVLTNASGVTCRVFGYPGMQLVEPSGGAIATDVVRTSPSPQLVSLAPGAQAFTQLHWTVVPGSGETSNPCEPVPGGVHVTPPDETVTLSTSWPGGSVCQHGQIFVTPLKAGNGS